MYFKGMSCLGSIHFLYCFLGFGGASVHFSPSILGNGSSPTDLTEEDLDALRYELTKVMQLLWNSSGQYGLLKLITSVFRTSCIDCFGLCFPFFQTEDEIQTLRQVLLAKEKYAADIRRQLGMSSLNNIKQSLSRGWQEVQTSSPCVHFYPHKHGAQIQ